MKAWRALILLAAAFLTLPGKARSEGTIEPLPGEEGAFIVTLQDEPADRFLERLETELGIAVVVRGEPSASSLSGSYRGTLSALLPRILRHEDLLIVHAAGREQTDGIEKVIVVRGGQARGRTVDRRAPPAPAPITSPPSAAGAGAPSSVLLGAGGRQAQPRVGAPGVAPQPQPGGAPSKPISEMTAEERRLYIEQQESILRQRLQDQRRLHCQTSGAC
ncbi:hypothetical protein [Limibacillus halophilus]